jgi:hypothetical protein
MTAQCASNRSQKCSADASRLSRWGHLNFGIGITAVLALASNPGFGQVKPSDVFFYDPAHPDQRGFPYNIDTGFAPKNERPAASIIAKDIVLRGWLADDPYGYGGNAYSKAVDTNEKTYCDVKIVEGQSCPAMKMFITN